MADRLYYVPIFVPEQTIYDRIGVEMTDNGGVGSVFRMGIYKWSAGVPGALVLDAGTVDAASNGQKLITISQELPRGYYYIAYISDGDPKMWACNATLGFMSPVQAQQRNVDDPLDWTVPAVGSRPDDATDGLVNPAPAPDRLENTTHALIRLREV